MIMPSKTLTATNWGGNIGVRLPKDFAEILGIKVKSKVQVDLVNGAIVITPVKIPREPIPLAERQRIAFENGTWDGKPYELTQEDKDWLNMPAVGEEIFI